MDDFYVGSWSELTCNKNCNGIGLFYTQCHSFRDAEDIARLGCGLDVLNVDVTCNNQLDWIAVESDECAPFFKCRTCPDEGSLDEWKDSVFWHDEGNAGVAAYVKEECSENAGERRQLAIFFEKTGR